jgi:nucleotide-binding universal stress UspA family protein
MLASARPRVSSSIGADEVSRSPLLYPFADDCNASLIVLGSHDKSGLTGIFLGSVAGAVAAHSGRTVLIVHRRA